MPVDVPSDCGRMSLSADSKNNDGKTVGKLFTVLFLFVRILYAVTRNRCASLVKAG
jgi:hypothetical protein